MKAITLFRSLELIEISPMLERVFESRVHPCRFCIIPRDNTVAFVQRGFLLGTDPDETVGSEAEPV